MDEWINAAINKVAEPAVQLTGRPIKLLTRTILSIHSLFLP